MNRCHRAPGPPASGWGTADGAPSLVLPGAEPWN